MPLRCLPLTQTVASECFLRRRSFALVLFFNPSTARIAKSSKCCRERAPFQRSGVTILSGGVDRLTVQNSLVVDIQAEAAQNKSIWSCRRSSQRSSVMKHGPRKAERQRDSAGWISFSYHFNATIRCRSRHECSA